MFILMPPEQGNPARNSSTFCGSSEHPWECRFSNETIVFEAASGVVIQMLHYRDTLVNTHKASDQQRNISISNISNWLEWFLEHFVKIKLMR